MIANLDHTPIYPLAIVRCNLGVRLPNICHEIEFEICDDVLDEVVEVGLVRIQWKVELLDKPPKEMYPIEKVLKTAYLNLFELFVNYVNSMQIEKQINTLLTSDNDNLIVNQL